MLVFVLEITHSIILFKKDILLLLRIMLPILLYMKFKNSEKNVYDYFYNRELQVKNYKLLE